MLWVAFLLTSKMSTKRSTPSSALCLISEGRPRNLPPHSLLPAGMRRSTYILFTRSVSITSISLCFLYKENVFFSTVFFFWSTILDQIDTSFLVSVYFCCCCCFSGKDFVYVIAALDYALSWRLPRLTMRCLRDYRAYCALSGTSPRLT